MNRMSIGKYMLLMVLAVILVLPSGLAKASGVDWNDAKITVQGMGIAPPRAVNPAQARMLARRAAVVDGYRQLAEAVQGVNVDAETTVENMMVTSDVIKTKVNAMIKGARVIAESVTPDGGYQVTMEVSMFGVSNSVAQAVLTKPAVVEAFPEPVASVAPAMPSVSVSVNVNANVTPAPSLPTPPSIPAVTPPAAPTPVQPAAPAAPQSVASNAGAIGGFTGLVVDCRGLGLKPVMSPVIKNAEGQSIYGYKNLDYDKVIAEGMAAYTTNPDKISRAGSNPLVVKAVSLDNHNGNPVLSVADANRVLLENGKSGFLDNLKVVFLR
ncbi:LPP20 family lipoprotein [Selenomonas ruminantium]|uniref:Lipoprotein LPP20-like domain-containing protein n=1 Tax=Selenomonas ruminantium TaxID=971 RepID=A0A1K1NKE5_SELRU|nr:LPP20 family lipoprotein [Selenomonas ruminantium]SFW35788.1 hypothetical protein SAMN02910323_1438 [Selenomonas ruminantium]